AGWASQMFGEPDVERLWQLVEFCVRLDLDDPVEAWRDHVKRLEQRARRLNELRLDAVRFTGPGTDLTAGLLREARWQGAEAVPDGGDRAHVLRRALRREHDVSRRVRRGRRGGGRG